MTDGDVKMTQFFTNMTASAKELKRYFNDTPDPLNTEKVKAHQTVIRHYSQRLWEDLF